MRLQLRSWSAAALALGLCAAARGAAADAFEEEPATDVLLQYFHDSQKIAVRSAITNAAIPMRSSTLTLHWNNERVVIPAIDAPAGSQEAIDAITTASRPISGNAYSDYIKIRNEFIGGVRHGGATLDYYYSTETDYLGQQLAGSYNRDLMDDQLNLSVGGSFGWDAITPLRDDDTQAIDDTKTTLHWNTVLTRVVSPTTVARVGVEMFVVEGLQHNPYRNVYAGGTNVPERHPDSRQRRDAFLRVNQYLSNRSSLRMSYRLYSDDWGILSHELGAKLSQMVTRGMFARWRYRYYTQTPAEFYRETYTSVDGVDGYRTADYRMGDLAAHLFGAAIDVDLDGFVADDSALRRLGLWLSVERYFNSNNYSSDTYATGITWRL